MTLKRAAGAAVEFEAILQRNPGDAVAANNAAVAKMYAVDLTGAVTALEKCLQVSDHTHPPPPPAPGPIVLVLLLPFASGPGQGSSLAMIATLGAKVALGGTP